MKRFIRSIFAAAAALTCLQGTCLAGNASQAVGEPVAEPATLRCLGAYWVIKGDDNKDARVEVDYRKAGTAEWKPGPTMFRIARGANIDKSISVPDDGWLFAGSVIDVPEATDYQVRLRLVDPDGGNLEKVIQTHTIAEPALAKGGPTYHVIPGSGGGTGTKEDPFKGIAAAESGAKPGDLFLVHAGEYQGDWAVKKSGEEGKPIVWRAAGDGDAVFSADHAVNAKGEVQGHLIDAAGRHDVWFEGLTVKGKVYSDVCLNSSLRMVVRGCHLVPFCSGIYATKDRGKLGQLFIADNVIEGVQPFPATAQQWQDIPENRGIWVGGRGNVICYNRVHNVKDGIDTAEIDKPPQVANDIHNNDVSNAYDDGSEMDGSWRNCRNFSNRYVNTLTGISLQPVHGGPIYVVRNALYNTRTEFLKLHNAPSGGVFVHNTFVHAGPLWWVSAEVGAENCYSRNNLFVGTEGAALNLDLPCKDLDFDYDGFAGFSGSVFMKYKVNGGRFVYATPAEAKAKSKLEKHAVAVEAASAFASGIQPPTVTPEPKNGATGTMGLKAYSPATIDLRLKTDSAAVDAGEVLRGFNEGFAGKAPDLGAYEVGAQGNVPGAHLPQYGPRTQRAN